jgi:glyoxylase-like metal-dependent hydrolase (beta-lactamase superfamily II)
LVNTHWHGDHTGGNENFANDGTILIGHKNVLDRLSRENVRGDQVTPPAPEKARSDIAFNDQLTLNLSGDQVYVHHVENAHTDGDAFVFFPKENVLHMGDCFFNGRFPYIDLSSGGSSKGYLMAISGALMMVDDDTVIIPGHGDLADKNSLNTFHDMLSTLITRMENALKSANTLEEIDVAQITSGYDGWGSGFINNERIAQILFEDLSK